MFENITTEQNLKIASKELDIATEQLNQISELLIGYREGSFGEMIQAIAGFKSKAMKYEFSENVEKMMSLIDDIAELKEDILSAA